MPSERNSPIVVHVVTSLDFGGVERHMEILASQSSTTSMQHAFCAIGRGGAAERALRRAGARVECLGKPTAIPSTQALLSLVSYFLRVKPTVVHTHGAEANFHGLLAGWIARIPVRVGEEIGIPRHSKIAKLLFSLVYRTANRVVGISDSVTRWLVESGEVPMAKAIRVYNPVVLPRVRRCSSGSANHFRVGFVGRLEPVKNAYGLLEAIKLLQPSDLKLELWIVGDGSERTRLEELVRGSELGNTVRLFGYKNRPERLMRRCHLYIQPSISEGFGLALVEAMSIGLPVVATAVGGAPEIVDHKRTGWLLESGDSIHLAEAIKLASGLGHASLQAMGDAAAQSVQGRFEPHAYMEYIEAIYSELLQRPKQLQNRSRPNESSEMK